MNEPLIAAVMLVNGRDAMVRRAIRSFLAQTYPNKMLITLDTTPRAEGYEHVSTVTGEPGAIVYGFSEPANNRSIGELRNRANALAVEHGADIIAHWDSDDVSHPLRLAVQYSALMSSDLTGFSYVLFWDTRPGTAGAWIYRGHQPRDIVGASLCYRAGVWKARGFDHVPAGEDSRFVNRHRGAFGLTGFLNGTDPLMCCGIHGANSQAYRLHEGNVWHREPEYDDVAREMMEIDANG